MLYVHTSDKAIILKRFNLVHIMAQILSICLLFLLTDLSTCAMAEWYKVVSGKSDTVYADSSSIVKGLDGKVKMWQLLDYNSAQISGEKTFMSLKRRTEFDCNKPQYRFLYTTYFSKNMGEGDLIAKDTTSTKWMPLPLITSAENLNKIACGKKIR